LQISNKQTILKLHHLIPVFSRNEKKDFCSGGQHLDTPGDFFPACADRFLDHCARMGLNQSSYIPEEILAQ